MESVEQQLAFSSVVKTTGTDDKSTPTHMTVEITAIGHFSKMLNYPFNLSPKATALLAKRILITRYTLGM